MLTYFSLKAVIGDADFNNDKQITFQEIYNLVKLGLKRQIEDLLYKWNCGNCGHVWGKA